MHNSELQHTLDKIKNLQTNFDKTESKIRTMKSEKKRIEEKHLLKTCEKAKQEILREKMWKVKWI